MAEHTAPASKQPQQPTREDLIRLLTALLDGIEGYQCEHGDLRYWNCQAVEEARRLADVAAVSR